MIVRIVPIMETFTRLGHLSVEGNRIDPEFLNSFGAYQRAYDPQTYKTSIKTNLTNLVLEEDLETITEPANAWITPRSSQDFEITEDDSLIPTTRPINVLNELYFRFNINYSVRFESNGTIIDSDPILLPVDEVGVEFFKGLGEFIFEETRYNILENNSNIVYDNTQPPDQQFTIGRGSALYFVQGEKNIFGLGSRSPSRFSLLPQRQALPNILNYISGPTEYAYLQFPTLATRPFLVESKINELINILDQKIVEDNPNIDPANIVERELAFSPYDPSGWSNITTQFRPVYKPFVETNITSYLPYNDANSSSEIISKQFFNQESNVVSINALEELHNRVINRGRGSTEILTYLGRTLDDIPEPGSKIDEFVLSSARHTINRTSITSDYNLDQFFAKLNKFVAVLEEYRQFSIPNENLVKRQFDREIFGKFRKEPTTTSAIISEEDYISSKAIRAIQVIPNFTFLPFGGGIDGERQNLPVVVTPFNNQIRIETEFITNSKTGDKSSEIDGEPKRRNEPVIHINNDGFLERMRVRLLESYEEDSVNWTVDDAHNLPVSEDKTATLFDQTEIINKDPREILRYSFSIHHIDDTQQGRVTQHWARHLGIVDNAGLNGPFIRLVFLDRKLEQEEKTENSWILYSRSMNTSIDGGITFTNFSVVNNNILLPKSINNGTDAQSWAIIDVNGEVLYYYNEEVLTGSENSQIYLVFEDKWNKELVYTVNFKDFDGTILKTDLVRFGEGAIPPADPVRAGFRFVDWDTDFSLILEDLDVIATYVETYQITYVLNGGTNNPANPSEYATEDTPITLLAPTKQNSNFLEWQPTNTIPEGSAEPLTFTAIFITSLAPPTIEQTIPYYTEPINILILDNPVVDLTIPYYTNPIDVSRLDRPVVAQTIAYYTQPNIFLRLSVPVVDQTITYYTAGIVFSRLANPIIENTIPYYTNPQTFTPLDPPAIQQTIPYYTNPITPVSNFTVTSNANPSDTANFIIQNNNSFSISVTHTTSSTGLPLVSGSAVVPANSSVTISRTNGLTTPQEIIFNYTISAAGLLLFNGNISQVVTATLDDTTTT
jgi:hypothetical protein